MKKVIAVSTINITAFVLLIIEIFVKDMTMGVITFLLWLLSLFGWLYLLYAKLSQIRIERFSEKIEALDRTDLKYVGLLAMYDYLKGNSVDPTFLQEQMKKVYFFTKKEYSFPEKIKKLDFYDKVIYYYLTLTHDAIPNSFFWDWNENYYTWRFIFLTFVSGVAGIALSVVCYHYIPHPNDVLYTALYFIFGALLIPGIAKFFGHFL